MEFTRIDTLIKREALSTEKIIEHWINTNRLDIGKLLKKYTCIPINRANLEKIKFGMIWYTDDTASQEFRPDKTVKSIILGVDLEYHVVYGDTLIEKLDISRTEMDLFLDDHPEFELASAFKLSQLIKNISDLNKILKKTGKPLWMGRTYWCAENIMQNGGTIGYSLPNQMKILIDSEKHHDFHPIYEYLVQY